MESSLAKDSLHVEGSSGDAVVVRSACAQEPQARTLVERWAGGGGPGKQYGSVELTGVGAGRGLCPLPPSQGDGGALVAPSSEPGAEPQKLCKKTFICSIIRPPPTLSFAVGCQHNS